MRGGAPAPCPFRLDSSRGREDRPNQYSMAQAVHIRKDPVRNQPCTCGRRPDGSEVSAFMAAAKPLNGRHALVTGAGSGIGAAIATTLAEAGASISLAGRRREPLEEIAGALGREQALVL